MRNYNQLTQTERYPIYALRKANTNPTEISRILGRHKTTIYREWKRNQGKRGYGPGLAHQFADQLNNRPRKCLRNKNEKPGILRDRSSVALVS